MPGVADDDDVERHARASKQTKLGARESRKRFHPEPELVALALPDRNVVLDDVDAGASEAGDDLGVAWVVTFVGSEGENPHERLAQNVVDELLGPLPVAQSLLVL